MPLNVALTPQQLRSLTPLSQLSEQQWWELRSQLVPQPLLAGKCLFKHGDTARLTYYLLAGELLLEAGDGVRQVLHAGSVQSCHPLAPALPRLCTARALTDASVLVVNTDDLDRLLTWRMAYQYLLLELAQQHSDLERLQSLLENPLFAKVPPANVHSMLARIQPIAFNAGEQVLREGESGDCCYFLQSGRAEVLRGAGSSPQVLAELEVGACFGEEALLADSLRNATVTMLESGIVLRLDRHDFVHLLKEPVINSLSLTQASRLLSSGAQWLDVRVLEEYQSGHALESRHMPLHLLRLKARLLDPKRTYLCYCDSGKRSANAVFLLSQLGFNAFALSGGVDSLPAMQREALLCEYGNGYVARSGDGVERSQ